RVAVGVYLLLYREWSDARSRSLPGSNSLLQYRLYWWRGRAFMRRILGSRAWAGAWEKDTIAFVPNFREGPPRDAGREVATLGEASEAQLMRPPPGYRHLVFKEAPREAVFPIADVNLPRHGAVPNHVQADARLNRRAIRKRVGQVEVVLNGEVTDVHL